MSSAVKRALGIARRQAKRYADGGDVFAAIPMGPAQKFKAPEQKSPNRRVAEGHQEFEQGYVKGWDTTNRTKIMNMRGQELDAVKIADGGPVRYTGSSEESEDSQDRLRYGRHRLDLSVPVTPSTDLTGRLDATPDKYGPGRPDIGVRAGFRYRFADGGPVDPEDESLAFADRPQMVSDEDLALAEINKKAAPREGGLMQTVPKFAGMVQTPEGRGKLTEGFRRWFTGDEKGEDKSWVPSPTENPIVKPIIEQVKGPREAMEGKMDREQMADWGAGTAMSLVGQGTFGAYAKPKGDIGIFGGRGSSTADLSAMQRAEQMERKGVNRDQIWRDTGWGRDVSGEWMYDLDMSKAKLADLPQHPFYPDNVHIPEGRSAPLEKVLPDPKLYQSYPFLRDYAVVGTDALGIGDSLGVLFEKQKTIAVSPQQPGSMFNTLIHEINHAIQSHEKFATGGNQAMFLPKEYQATALALQNQERLLNKFLAKQRIPVKDAWDAMFQAVHDPGSLNPRQESLVKKVVRGGKYDSLADFIEKSTMHLELRKEAESNYYRLAGEISSRNAEFRAKMTPEQSRQVTPWESQTQMRRPVAPGKELTVEFSNNPTTPHSAKDDDQFITRRMTPEEAKRWISENTPARDPIASWGYVNPYDYVRLAEAIQGIQAAPNVTEGARIAREHVAGDLVRSSEPRELPRDPIAKAYKEFEAATREWERLRGEPDINAGAIAFGKMEDARRHYDDLVEKDRRISSYNQEQSLAGDPFAEASDLTGGTPYEPPKPQPLTLERLLTDFTPDRIRQLSYDDLALANQEIKEILANNKSELEEIKQRYPKEWAALDDQFHNMAMEEYANRDFAPPDAESGAIPPEPPPLRSEPRLATNSLVANFDKYLAPHFENTNAFIENYFGGMANPRDVTLNWDRSYGFVASSELRNKEGRIIGSVSRQFNPETKSAYHSYLRIDEGERGKGSIPAMLENQINLYMKLGIEKVKLGANIDVGGYAWAKYGFLPQKFEWAYMADRFKDMIATGQVRISRNIPRNKNYSPMDAVMEVLNNPEPEAIWHLTDLKIQAAPNKSIGKFFLLNTSWGGTLHLTRPDAFNRFMEYVAVRKKAHEKR